MGRLIQLAIATSLLLCLQGKNGVLAFQSFRSSAFQHSTPTRCESATMRLLPRPTKRSHMTSLTAMPPALDWSVLDSSSFAEGTSNILSQLASVDYDQAEALAGPFFGFSLFPYIAFLYFLNVKENNTPKGVTVGFAVLLLFVFLTIPAAIAAKVWYGASLADCDWLHASAESLLTGTNLVTVVAFREALTAAANKGEDYWAEADEAALPVSVTKYAPMAWLMAAWTLLAAASAILPATMGQMSVHEPFLGGFLDLPASVSDFLVGRPEPANALSIGCWIIHISSLVEFLVIMENCWQWAEVSRNPKWKGLVWGLIPLHSSGITACTFHFFYNQIPILVPLQAFLTCVGNVTAAYAAWRIANSNAWVPDIELVVPRKLPNLGGVLPSSPVLETRLKDAALISEYKMLFNPQLMKNGLMSAGNDYGFLVKLFAGCAVASYAIKYGETWFSFPYEADLVAALSFIGIASSLNAFKWYQRSQDPSFDGWF